MTDPVEKPEADPNPTDDPKPPEPSVTFTAEQEAEINRRMAATRKATEADVKKRFETEAEERKRLAAEQAERDKQIAAGEFDKVKADLEAKLTAATTDIESHKARADRAIALLAGRVEEQVKTLTERDAELAKAFPADADVLDQIAWLEDPRTKRVLTAEPATATFRQPRTPSPAGSNGQDDDAARKQLQKQVSRQL